jgi:hypothetical protein
MRPYALACNVTPPRGWIDCLKSWSSAPVPLIGAQTIAETSIQNWPEAL